MEMVISWPTFAEGTAGPAGIPVAAVETMAMPFTTFTVADPYREPSRDEVARI